MARKTSTRSKGGSFRTRRHFVQTDTCAPVIASAIIHRHAGMADAIQARLSLSFGPSARTIASLPAPVPTIPFSKASVEMPGRPTSLAEPLHPTSPRQPCAGLAHPKRGHGSPSLRTASKRLQSFKRGRRAAIAGRSCSDSWPVSASFSEFSYAAMRHDEGSIGKCWAHAHYSFSTQIRRLTAN